MDASPFAKLSPELRLKIYESALQQPTQVVVSHFVRGVYPDPMTIDFRLNTGERNITALLDTCWQARKEATDIFYTANEFLFRLENKFEGAYRRLEHEGDYPGSDVYQTMTDPFIKFLNTVETRCDGARSAVPSMRVTIKIGHQRILCGGIVRAGEDAMAHLLRTLRKLSDTYAAKRWGLDIVVWTSVHGSIKPNATAPNGGIQIAIKDGYTCFEEWIQNVVRRREGSARYDPVEEHNVKVLRRWQQIFDAS